ncbi:MAG: hypothetical protein IPK07_23340 [Deltaproteobacteria bacterium]|jgi:hypothetical protein|nr:hypothetical protein [Deltaproteobacteria bacterium]
MIERDEIARILFALEMLAAIGAWKGVVDDGPRAAAFFASASLLTCVGLLAIRFRIESLLVLGVGGVVELGLLFAFLFGWRLCRGGRFFRLATPPLVVLSFLVVLMASQMCLI